MGHYTTARPCATYEPQPLPLIDFPARQFRKVHPALIQLASRELSACGVAHRPHTLALHAVILDWLAGHGGQARISHAGWLAVIPYTSERSLERAVAELKRAGLLAVSGGVGRGRGRGQACEYALTAKLATSNAPSETGHARGLGDFNPENLNIAAAADRCATTQPEQDQEPASRASARVKTSSDALTAAYTGNQRRMHERHGPEGVYTWGRFDDLARANGNTTAWLNTCLCQLLSISEPTDVFIYAVKAAAHAQARGEATASWLYMGKAADRYENRRAQDEAWQAKRNAEAEQHTARDESSRRQAVKPLSAEAKRRAAIDDRRRAERHARLAGDFRAMAERMAEEQADAARDRLAAAIRAEVAA